MQNQVIVLLPNDEVVTVATIATLLAPYELYVKVEPYRELISQYEIDYIVDAFELADDDLRSVKDHIQIVNDLECFIEDGKLYWLNTDNPLGKWDGWRRPTLQDDIWPVEEVPHTFTPAAVLTPDGEWHDLDYAWPVSADRKVALWAQAQPFLERYAHHTAVMVDFHH